MSTENVEVFNRYYGNGVATQFSIGFPYLKREFVKVYLYKKDTDEENVLNSDQFSFVNDGIIQYPVLPADEILKEGDILTIQRETELGSEFEFDNQRRLFPVEVMNADDLAFQQIQELSREIKRAVRVNPTATETPEELLNEVYGKLDSASEIANEAIAAANEATVAAEQATTAVEEAKRQVIETQEYVDNAKLDINNTVEAGKQEINTTIDEAQMNLSDTIEQAVDDVKAEAVAAAEGAIQGAADTAIQIATDHANTVIKPELQTYVDSSNANATVASNSADAAMEYANSASTSAINASASATRAETAAAQASQSSGKIVQLGFDGAMQDGKLVFKHAPSGIEVPYELLDDYEYEVDMLYSSTEELSNDVQMYVKNGADIITFVSSLHRDSTSYATVGEMSSVMRFNEDTGYRWLFKAAYKITPAGKHVLLLYPVISSGGAGSGLEIGDIGFAPLGIDETQNKRRYLNGQVISQAQFVSFTDKIKSAIQLYPSLATSETNWQAEVTNSKLGQCGKFVIDDTLGTIRLPKVVNINGLQDLNLLGGIKAESLPNITGEFVANVGYSLQDASGAFSLGTLVNATSFAGSSSNAVKQTYILNASKSSSTYQDNAPVQQEAVQYPYFIQVATGTEESVDVTREIELNNPFSLLDYKWSEYEITNASWLISNGTFHSGATYIAVYNLLLEIYNGTVTKDGVSVKLNEQQLYCYSVSGLTSAYLFTSEEVEAGQDVYGYNSLAVRGTVISVDSNSVIIKDIPNDSQLTLTRYQAGDKIGSIYTDTDFVINTADTTFRLPIKVKLASGNAVAGNGTTLGISNGTINAGLVYDINSPAILASVDALGVATGSNITTATNMTDGKTLGVTTDPLKSGIETSSNGLKLYFYVGETIQDANVVNASGVLTRVAELSNEYIVGLGVPDYDAGISLSGWQTTNTSFTVPCAGYIHVVMAAVGGAIETFFIDDIPCCALINSFTQYVGFAVGGRFIEGGFHTFRCGEPSRTQSVIFYPCKGVI